MANPNPFLTSPSDDRADLYKLPDLPQSKAADSSRFEPVDPSEITVPARGATPTRADVIRRAVELDVDPRLALSIWSQESTSGANTKTSSKGARGGFQVMPGTYTSMMKTSDGQDDPWNNMEAGLRYIAYGQKTLGTRDPALLAAGYHAGYERDSLKRGEIPNVSDGKKNTRDYAREVAGRVGGTDAKAPDVTEGGRFEPVSAADLRKFGIDAPELDDLQSKLDKDEPGRFQVLTPDDLKAAGLGQASLDIKKAPDAQAPGFIEEYVTNPLKRGWNSMKQGFATNATMFNARQLETIGKIDRGEKVLDADDPAGYQYMTPDQRADFKKQAGAAFNSGVQKVAELGQENAKIPQDPIVAAASNAKSFDEWWQYFKQAPFKFIANTGVESLPNMAPGLALGGLAGLGAKSLVAGAAGMGAGSYAVDYPATVISALQDKGIDTTNPDALAKAFSDPKIMADVQKQAHAHALAVGALDAVSGGRAEATIVAGKTLARRGANAGAKIVEQGTLGASGEAAGQIAQGKKELEWGNIMGEFAGEAAGAPVEAAGAAYVKGKELVKKGVGGQPAEAQNPVAQPTQPAPAPGPSTAPGPMTRAAENAADKHAADNGAPRVTVTAPNGEAVQGEMHAYQETPDGGFTAQIVGDDGQVYTLSDKDGVTIQSQEHDAGPLTGAAHAVAETQTAPVAQPEAQAEPAAPAEQPAADAVQPPVKEPAKARQKVEADLTAMSMEELRARLKYVASQAKDSGWNTMLMAERKRVEREINKRADEQSKAQQAEAQTALPIDGTYSDRADANAAMLKAAETTGKPHQVVEQGGKFTIQPIQEEANAPANDARVEPVSAPAAQPAKPAESGAGGAAAGKPAAVEPPALSKEAAPAKVPSSVKPAAPAEKDAHAGKWFGSREKADAYLTKKKIGDTHQVEQTGKVRFEIKPKVAPASVEDVTGKPIDKEWTAFAPESGTLNIDRAEMPQIKSEHRGAMVNFLNARGITHEQVEVPSGELKPTQREFSPAKVQKAKQFEGGDRSILISSDNHVLDGHHQWLAKRDENEPVKAIRLNAPIRELLGKVKEFPSADIANGTTAATTKEQPNARTVQPEQEKPAVPAATDGKPVAADVESQSERSSTQAAPTQGEVNGNQEARTESPGQERADVQASHADTENGEKGNAADAADEKGQQPGPVSDKNAIFANNKLITIDRIEAARARLRSKLTQLNSGIDPEIVMDGMTIAAGYIEAGVRKFADFAKIMSDDFGPKIKPFLLSFYEGARHYPGLDTEGMTSPAAAKKAHDSLMADMSNEQNSPTIKEEEAGNERTDQPGVETPDRTGVPATRRQRGNDPQQGAAQRDFGNLEAGQPANVQAPAESGNGGQAGLRPAAADVEPSGRTDEGGTAANGRTRAGGKGNPDAGAGSRRARSGGKAAAHDAVSVEKHPDTVSPANPGPGDFHIDDPLRIVGGGQVARFEKNRAAIELRNKLIDEGRQPTREEQEMLAGYTGWGSFGQELFQGTWENPKPKAGWEQRDSWLRDNLGKAEWEGMQRSIINAHYTDPPTVLAMWDMVKRMGFAGGRVLEPSMGIGNFYGMMPAELVSRSNRAGIELDPVTGSMAQMLYPDANIKIMGYEQSKTPDNFYDLVIGNWPFADYSPADRRYNRLSPMLHDYFFLKALDQTRPGGIVIGITSAGTMDKKDSSVRTELAKKGELVAAFRLPSGAFEEYAGTKVVTDIIVLRKRAEPAGIVAGEGWIRSKPMATKEGTEVSVNEYYHAHPENVIGTIDYGHGTTTFRPGMIVHRPADMMEQLKRIVSLVPENAYQADTRGKQITYVANHTSDRTGALTKTKDGLFIVQGEYLAPANQVAKYALKSPEATAKREAQLSALIELRQLYGKLIDAERAGKAETERTALRNAYEAFKAEHGSYSESFGLQYLRKIEDPFWPALSALESYTEDKAGNRTYRPAAILSESTIRGAKKLENPSVPDAFVLARNESVNPSPERIAEIAGKPVAEVRRALIESGAAFETPGGDFVPSDIYLSGNVREKLRQAQAGLEQGNAAMARNVEALKKVIPPDVPYYKIETQMGATWVPPKAYADYIAHMLGLKDAKGIEVGFQAGAWKVDFPAELNHRAEAASGFGTQAVKFKRLVRAAIANQTITVKIKDMDGNLVVSEELTKEANAKIADMRMKFGEWLWQDPVRRVELEQEYNETRNAYATPKFDGSFLGFQGMALTLGRGPFNLREHQVNAIWRALVTRKSLNAHEVGTGKTFTMGGIAVESRRYGIAKKPVIFAHNANSKSVAHEIGMMYPAAKVLYVDNLSKENVKTRMAQIANDDWDAIVLPHSLIDRIGFKEDTLMAMAQKDIDDLMLAAEEAATEDNVKITPEMWDDEKELNKLRSTTAKQLVKQRQRIIETIKKLSQQASREDSIAFEDTGIDMILVDEAHEFKKPPIATKMKMKGLQTQTSNRSIAMSFLTKYVRGMQNGGNVHLFTGTPITNTMTEVFHMMRYMMNEEMEGAGLADWDGWFGSFAREVNDVELSSTGEYEAVTRLQSFINVPELRRMIGQYMDVVFADDMPEMKPRTVNGKKLSDKSLTEAERAELLNGRTENAQDRPYKKVVNESADMTPEQTAVFNEVQQLAKRWRNMGKKERKEAMQRGAPEVPIIHDAIAEKASFDVRLVNAIENAGKEGTPELAPHPDSKPARVVKSLIEIYRSHPQANQVVFMEQGMAKSVTRSEGEPGAKVSKTYPAFSTMHDMIERLVQAGIPREEIATVTGATSKDKRKEIADAMNSGKVRIVFGSTDSLGVGVNMQKNLRAMHHMDAPWMPGELEQRNGRGHRQGNQWNTVLEHRYLTDRLDGRRWQVLAIKQRFITDFMKSNGEVRVIEGDAASDEQSDILSTFSDAAGDPRVLIKEKLKKKLDQLHSRERLHAHAQAKAIRSSNSLKNMVDRLEQQLSDLKASGVVQQAADLIERQKGEGFTAEIGGKRFDKRSEAAEFIKKWLPQELRIGEDKTIGTYGGVPLSAEWSKFASEPYLRLDIGRESVDSNGPSLASLENGLRDLRDNAERKIADRIAKAKSDLGHLETVIKEPFHMADKLADAQQQLADLERDIAENPVAPPYWLRSGAPTETEVYWNDKPFTVTGHRWNDKGWFVLAQDDKGDVAIPYLEARDAQGMPLYEEREFAPPTVIQKDEAKKAAPTEQADEAQAYSVNLGRDPAELEAIFDGLEARGLSRQRALQTLNSDPDAAIIRYINDNFFTILGELDDSGKVVIKC
ncbi:MAG TPA: helicase-related protein [Noviherbaspirillum sp.]|nr:helicase-related protein [Noviherbaspirillum sp.]